MLCYNHYIRKQKEDIMKKILLTIIGLGLATLSADTICTVTKSIPTYKTVNVKTAHIKAYNVNVATKIQCGILSVDEPNSNTMKAIPKFCNGNKIETHHRITYTYDIVKKATKYTNYFRYLGKQYTKDSSTPLKQVIVR